MIQPAQNVIQGFKLHKSLKKDGKSAPIKIHTLIWIIIALKFLIQTLINIPISLQMYLQSVKKVTIMKPISSFVKNVVSKIVNHAEIRFIVSFVKIISFCSMDFALLGMM